MNKEGFIQKVEGKRKEVHIYLDNGVIFTTDQVVIHEDLPFITFNAGNRKYMVPYTSIRLIVLIEEEKEGGS